MINRQAIVCGVLGKPYREGAAGPDAFDCLGLARHLLGALYGLDVPTTHATMIRARALFRPAVIPTDGAIVVMRGQDNHVGIWLSRERVIIHAVEKRGVVVDSPNALTLSGFGRPRYFNRRCTSPLNSEPSPASMP